MKRLMIDMDNCITDALFMDRINEFLGTNYKLEEQTEFRLQKITGDRIDEFWQFMKDKSFYDDAPLIKGAYKALEILNKKYDLYIITAFIYPNSNPDISSNNLKFKYEYLKKKLPFISPKQYIFIENKNLIHSDIAIDDKITHLIIVPSHQFFIILVFRPGSQRAANLSGRLVSQILIKPCSCVVIQVVHQLYKGNGRILLFKILCGRFHGCPSKALPLKFFIQHQSFEIHIILPSRMDLM